MIEERINMFIEMYQCQLNGANERLKEDVRVLIKAEQDGSTYYLDKKNYLSNLTKEINDTEQMAYIIKEFLDSLKLIKKEVTSKWIPFTFDEEGILNCELPDVDEEILVSDGDSVWQDTWCEADEGYELESGIEIEDLAWRQLPKPYEENQNETNC